MEGCARASVQGCVSTGAHGSHDAPACESSLCTAEDLEEKGEGREGGARMTEGSCETRMTGREGSCEKKQCTH